jgi:ribosome-associated protein
MQVLMDSESSPSKSRIKRELRAVQDLGRELVELPDKQLDKLDLPDDLRATIRAARALAKGARKRQIRYIGAQLAREDVDTLRQALNALLNPGRDEVERFHVIERARDRLIDGGEPALEEFLAVHPLADRQHVRQLVRNAVKERTADKPPRAARLLYRYLRDLPHVID